MITFKLNYKINKKGWLRMNRIERKEWSLVSHEESNVELASDMEKGNIYTMLRVSFVNQNLTDCSLHSTKTIGEKAYKEWEKSDLSTVNKEEICGELKTLIPYFEKFKKGQIIDGELTLRFLHLYEFYFKIEGIPAEFKFKFPKKHEKNYGHYSLDMYPIDSPIKSVNMLIHYNDDTKDQFDKWLNYVKKESKHRIDFLF
jgi:hypothetical protein